MTDGVYEEALYEELSEPQQKLCQLSWQAKQAQLDRIEAKLDEVLAFHAVVAEAAAPFLSGKGHKWLALVAKAKGGRT